MRPDRERHRGPDILKCICAFLIVCIHAPFPGEAGRYFLSLTRVAVPIFFMITGFYYDDVKRRGRVKAQIVKVLRLFVSANLLYFGWGLLASAADEGPGAFLAKNFGLRKLLRFALFNEALFSSHLWYLGALLYVLVIRAVLDRLFPHSSGKILYALTPLLLAGDLVLGKYSLVILGREFPYILVRNFLFVGIPYFSIGCFLYEKRDHYQVRREWNLLLIGLFAATTLLERYLLESAGLGAQRDHYISTTFLAVMIFILFMDSEWEQPWTALPSRIGREYSTFIYIVHPILIKIIGKVVGLSGSAAVTEAYGAVRPVVIYAASVLLAAVSRGIRKSIYKRRFG